MESKVRVVRAQELHYRTRVHFLHNVPGMQGHTRNYLQHIQLPKDATNCHLQSRIIVVAVLQIVPFVLRVALLQACL